jgi:hypothetical protein
MNTAISLVVDRSGSMHNIASDTVGSVKQFIKDQRALSGAASLVLTQFDDEIETVYAYGSLQNVDEEAFGKQYAPRGSTALLDAIGRAVINLSAELAKLPETERPERKVVAIVTDGYENSSREFTKEKIAEMVKAKEAEGWNFIFLGATLDAINVAQSYGFKQGSSSCFKTSNVGETIGNCLNGVVERIRKGGEACFTQEEREVMSG